MRSLLVVGHSVAVGGGASDPSRRYTSLLAAELGLRERNLAVGGAITCWEQGGRDPGDGGWEWVLSQVAPDPSVAVAIAHFGLNDLPVLGHGLRPLQEALRTVLVALRAGEAGRPGGRLRRARPFSGPACDVVVRVEPEFAGEAVVSVDGVASSFGLDGAELSDRVTGRSNGVTLHLRAPAPGRHAVSVAGAPWVAWSAPSPEPPLVIVPLGHRVLDWGWYAGWPHRCRDEDVEVLNAALEEVVASFDARVVALDIDAVLGKDPRLFAADRFYPNDLGHERIAEALAAVVRDASVALP